MAQYNIKDLENLSGIKAHTIRIWEKRYNIINPRRTNTNIRTYDDKDLKRLLNISILNNHGIKISHLAKLDNSEILEKVLDISQNTKDYNTQVESLILAMLNLDEAYFHQIFNKSIKANGFELTFEEIVLKLLDRIGILWLTGTINPAQEHFISNLIRQKIISNIDALSPSKFTTGKRFTLFLPEGEMHELGLLYACFLLKKRGHEVLYFGQLTPLESVIESEKKWISDFLIISLVAPLNEVNTTKLLTGLISNFSHKKIIFTGAYSSKIDISLNKNIYQFSLIKDFTDFLESL